MNQEITIAILSISGSGLLMAVLSIPMIMQKVSPNRWYGFRTKKALSDETIWYEMNAYCGWWMLGFGFLMILLGLGFLLPPLITEVYALVTTVLILIYAVIMLLACFARQRDF